MQIEKMLQDVRERLAAMTIFDVRQVAREVKAHVTSGQKGVIIESVLNIATGKDEPAQASKRGAPPKSVRYDERLVADIFALREYFTALKNGENKAVKLSVNDSGDNCYEKEYSGYLAKDGENYVLLAEEKLFVPDFLVSRHALRTGDLLRVTGRKKNEADLAGAVEVLSINGFSADGKPERRDFSSLTRVYPEKRVELSSAGDVTLRMIDLFAPVALGQRGVISSPASCGKTWLIKSIAHGICHKYRGIEVIILTLGARPEEITEFKKSSDNFTLFNTSFDKSDEEHLLIANVASDYAKRRVELKKDVVILADGLYENLPAEAVKNFLYCALNAEEGGSLTVIAAMPQYSNAAGAANMVITLSPELKAERIFPAIDILKSYTGREERLLSEEELSLAVALRSKLSHGASAGEIVGYFKETETNVQIAEIIKNGR